MKVASLMGLESVVASGVSLSNSHDVVTQAFSGTKLCCISVRLVSECYLNLSRAWKAKHGTSAQIQVRITETSILMCTVLACAANAEYITALILTILDLI